jgi:hypothetical protein
LLHGDPSVQHLLHGGLAGWHLLHGDPPASSICCMGTRQAQHFL